MDLLGRAISDFFEGAMHHRLWVHDHHGPKTEMPVAYYFRTEADMPEMEVLAMDLCSGKTLDIGAGAGSHTLYLQDKGIAVTAMDISAAAVRVMEERGVEDVILGDIFSYDDVRYDTLLLLMNGIGLVSTIEGLKSFLTHAKRLLQPGGQIIFDSSDVAYLFEEGVPREDPYYGEIECRYEYRRQKTEWFRWLYIDQQKLKQVAAEAGWAVEILMEDESNQYLARMQLKA
jgi:SAM-dependent methyltransferase